VSTSVRSLRFRQFFEHYGAQQHSIAFDQRQVRGDNDLSGAEQLPNRSRRRLIQEPREDGTRLGIEIHRGPRSSSSNCAALRRRLRRGSGNAGYKFGSPAVPKVTSPRLASSCNPAGTEGFVCPCPGGNNSATTSPRSVTSTLSPKRTLRRYSLSRFFNSRTPTDFMRSNVATRSYICQESALLQNSDEPENELTVTDRPLCGPWRQSGNG
jgi:hypothetical protein